MTATTIYTATAAIKIDPQAPSVTGIGMFGTAETAVGGPYDYYQTQYRLLESYALAETVVAKLGSVSLNRLTDVGPVASANPVSRITGWVSGWFRLLASSNSSKPVLGRDEASGQKPKTTGSSQKTAVINPAIVGRYRQFLEVSPVKNTRLVEIHFRTPDPELSQTLADAHASGFIRFNVESRFELTKEAREFLDGKNTELKRKLERSEETLNRFRQQHGIVSMEKGENIVVDRLVDLNKQLTTARSQRIEAESLYKSIEGKSTQYLTQVLSQGLVPSLRATLATLEAEKGKLSLAYTPSHPRIIEMDQQIKEAKASLTTEITNGVRSVRENFVVARAKEQALQTEADKQQQAALSLKQAGVEYAVLEEEVKVNRALYENVLKRLHETNVSNDLAASNIQIAQRAQAPSEPSSPSIPINLLISSVLGFLLGAALSYFLEYMDATVSTPERVWRAVGLTPLGVVPDLTKLKPRVVGFSSAIARLSGSGRSLITREPVKTTSEELVFSHHPLSVVTDCYWTIRTGLLLAQGEKRSQVFLLTSPSPGDGKTTTTLNLATILAQDGHEVLVIDGDLRKGTCHTRMGLNNSRGLANFLSGEVSLQEVIQKTIVTGLSLISRGECHTNPSELLGSKQMRDLLANIRDSFDFILIDSPPIIAIPDASVLSAISDGVVFVLSSDQTTVASVRKAMGRLESVGSRVLGVILNRIDIRNPDYTYYREYYGSKYGDIDKDQPRFKGSTGNGLPPALAQTEPFSFAEHASASVPNEVLDLMSAKLSEFAGPMAPIIVHDSIHILGESPRDFPKSRLHELLKKVSQEIVNDDLRNVFEEQISKQFESFYAPQSAVAGKHQ